MKIHVSTLCLVAVAALSACAKTPPVNQDTGAATAAGPASPPTSGNPPAGGATADARASAGGGLPTPAQEGSPSHVGAGPSGAVDAGATPGGTDGAATVQAGWYRAGTFQSCGSSAAVKATNAGDIEKQIKAGGMQPGDPVYVRVEGSTAGGVFNVTRVVQVGSPTPVRDCAMTGVVTQSR